MGLFFASQREWRRITCDVQIATYHHVAPRLCVLVDVRTTLLAKLAAPRDR